MESKKSRNIDALSSQTEFAELTEILDSNSKADLDRAAAMLRAGRLVVFPTETVYGLGANAFDPGAAARIFLAKGRPADNPLIVHIPDIAALTWVARDIPEAARVLFEQFSPGPLTVILPKSEQIAGTVSAGLDTVGVRIPSMSQTRDFLERCAVPVAAPSANRSGMPSPTNLEMSREAMMGRVAAILKGPDSTLGLESTIVYPEPFTHGVWRVHVLRPGSIAPEAILASLEHAGMSANILFNGKELGNTRNKGREHGIRAPGTRYRHYSPAAAVKLYSDRDGLLQLLSGLKGQRVLVIGVEGAGDTEVAEAGALDGNFERIVFADLDAYAHALYRTLFEADQRHVAVILAWLPPREGLGIALSDRLSRAAGLL